MEKTAGAQPGSDHASNRSRSTTALNRVLSSAVNRAARSGSSHTRRCPVHLVDDAALAVD